MKFNYKNINTTKKTINFLFTVSHKLGFGLMDGGAMVNASLTWHTVPPQLMFSSTKIYSHR